LRFLVTAPRPKALGILPDPRCLEATWEALEDQGEALQMVWVWPPTLARLSQYLAEGAQGTVLLLDAVLTGDGVAVFGEGAAAMEERLSAARLAELSERALLTVLIAHPLLSSASPVDGLAQELATHESRLLLLDGRLGPQKLHMAVSAFSSALLAGEPLVGCARALAAALDEDAGEHWRLLAPDLDVALVQPAVEANQGVSKIVRFPDKALQPPHLRLSVLPEPGGLPAEPAHGLIGRARVLRELERLLDPETLTAPVWLYGYAGLGKTTLAAHLARWLVRTGRYARVVYTTFQGGLLRDGALADLGGQLIGQDFRPADQGALDKVLEALPTQPTLVIWDHLDALLPGGEAGVPQSYLEGLAELARGIAGCANTSLLLIADGAGIDELLHALGSTERAIGLGPFTDDEAELFWQTVAPAEAAQEIEALLQVLGGHPLALSIVAQMRRRGSLEEILSTMEEILPGLSSGEARLRNQAPEVALEALLRQEAPDVLPPLYGLGLFGAGFLENLGLDIVSFEAETWAPFREAFVGAGLLREERQPGLAVPYLAFHPLLARFLEQRLARPDREQLSPRFYYSYYALMDWLLNARERLGGRFRILVRRELPNLRRGLRLALEREELVFATDYNGRYLRVLQPLGLANEAAWAMAEAQHAIARATAAEGPLRRSGVLFLLSQAQRMMDSGSLAEAGTMLQQLVGRMEKENGLAYAGAEARIDLGRALRLLARSYRQAGRPDVAMAALQRARQALAELSDPEGRRELLAVHLDIATTWMVAGQHQRVVESLQQGLTLAEALDDKPSLLALHRLWGQNAAAQKDGQEARAHFQEALKLAEGLEDKAAVARLWQALGQVAWDLERDGEEARRAYSQALAWAQDAGDAALEGGIHVALARMAEQEEDAQEAEAAYSRAIAVFEAHELKPARAAAEMSLGHLLLRQGRVAEARAHAEAARVTVEGTAQEEGAGPWQLYDLLRRVAEAEGDAERVRHWRRRTQQVFARSPEAASVLQRWAPLIQQVAAACRGQALDVKTVELIERMAESEAWRELSDVIWRILGGERGEDLVEDLDHVDALVVRTILRAIEAPETPSPASAQEQSDR